MKYILIVAVLIFNLTVNAQIQIKCGNDKIIIPKFKIDSATSFQNKFTEDKIIYPIMESNAEIEIRIYIPYVLDASRGKIWSIVIDKDSSKKALEYNYIYNKYAIPYDKTFDTIGRTKDQSLLINRKIITHQFNLPIQLFLKTLITNNLFILHFETEDMVGFKNPCDIIPDCGTSYVCEIKVRNLYRNFRLTAKSYYETNPSIKNFEYSNNIQKVFDQIFSSL